MDKTDFMFMCVGSEIILKGKSLKFLRSFNDFTQIELVGINADYYYYPKNDLLVEIN